MAKGNKKFHLGRLIVVLIVVFVLGSSVAEIVQQLVTTKQLNEEISETKSQIEYYEKQNELLEDPVYATQYLRTKYFSEEGEILYIFPDELEEKEN